MAWALTFLERYNKDGNEFLSDIITGDKTWVSFANVEIAVKAADAQYSPNKSKKFKQMLSACQKAVGNYFLGQERSADGGIHATRHNNNGRSVL
jgi:hypothetical protein